ncbi:uncharacterized protein [Onthophagus taurus]|uniref:uncharacterized protein n=1 Tax=Onthophagus taurus TaxID=166361 RepID=UPI000C200DB9|nr:uncharacterized protein LOC111420221 [Onthophagus taurus]
MAEQHYNVTAEQRKILEEKAKRRLVLRNEFLKQSANPYRHALNEGGTVFDPAVQRFVSMKVTTYEHFKPNFKNSIMFLALAGIPFSIYSYFMYKSRTENEARYRRGEIAYKDRLFKFI